MELKSTKGLQCKLGVDQFKIAIDRPLETSNSFATFLINKVEFKRLCFVSVKKAKNQKDFFKKSLKKRVERHGF